MVKPTPLASRLDAILEPESRRNVHRASCEGKEPFESRAVAEQVARRRRSQGRRRNMSYKCKGCGKYHIGESNRR